MVGVPAGAIAERRIITRLLRADAMSAAQAQPLDRLSWIQRRRLQRLLNAAVITETQPGSYYLNAPALADRMTNRRIRVAIVMAILIMLFGVSLYFVVPGTHP